MKISLLNFLFNDFLNSSKLAILIHSTATFAEKTNRNIVVQEGHHFIISRLTGIGKNRVLLYEFVVEFLCVSNSCTYVCMHWKYIHRYRYLCAKTESWFGVGFKHERCNQGDQMSLWKNPPKVCPNLQKFCVKIVSRYITFSNKKFSEILGYFCNFSNNCTAQNKRLPNLVTLVGTVFSEGGGYICSHFLTLKCIYISIIFWKKLSRKIYN
jgi:hypothetical protein